MTKAPKKSEGEPELRPDGWQRFENAVDAAIKSGPKHRESKSSSKTAEKSKGKKEK